MPFAIVTSKIQCSFCSFWGTVKRVFVHEQQMHCIDLVFCPLCYINNESDFKNISTFTYARVESFRVHWNGHTRQCLLMCGACALDFYDPSAATRHAQKSCKHGQRLTTGTMPTGEELLKVSEPVRRDFYLRLKEEHSSRLGATVEEIDNLIDTYPAFELRTRPHAKSPQKVRPPPTSPQSPKYIPVDNYTPSMLNMLPESSNVEAIATSVGHSTTLGELDDSFKHFETTPFMDDDDESHPPSGSEMGYHSASDTRPIYGGTYTTGGGGKSSTASMGFYQNAPAGQSYTNTSPPGSVNQHAPPVLMSNYADASNPPASYGPTVTSAGPPTLGPQTPLLGGGGGGVASPPHIYSNPNLAKGFEYDYSGFVPPSALYGAFGGGGGGSPPTSPTFAKRSSLPPGAASPTNPNYNALAVAAGIGIGIGMSPSSPPPSAYPADKEQSRVRRTSNAPSVATTTASQYSTDGQMPGSPRGVNTIMPSVAEQVSTPAPMPMPSSRSGHSHSDTSGSGHGPVTPAPGFVDVDAHGRLVRRASSPWDVEKEVMGGKGGMMGKYDGSEESLRDDEDYSGRRVLQVTNPS